MDKKPALIHKTTTLDSRIKVGPTFINFFPGPTDIFKFFTQKSSFFSVKFLHLFFLASKLFKTQMQVNILFFQSSPSLSRFFLLFFISPGYIRKALLTAEDIWFFCDLYLQFIAPFNLWNKCIGLRLLSKCLEGPFLRPLRSTDVQG